MPDLGDVIPLAIEVRGADGEPTNASTVTLTITLPDGTTESPVVDNPPEVDGLYTYYYQPDVQGRFRASWVSTGPSAAYTDIFDVRDPSEYAIISLATAKLHLNMSLTQTRDDEELRMMIESVTAVIERHRSEVIAQRTIVETGVLGGRGVYVLASHPVVSLTSIVDGNGVTQTLGNWTLDRSTGQLVCRTGSPSDDITVTYVAGYSKVPANYVLAAKIILQHLWQTQRIQSIGQQPTLGAVSRQTEQIVTPSGTGFAIPYRAIELLGARPSIIV